MKKINKPSLSLTQIINMSVGFLGIQFGFALQNGNASRILQTYGADVEHLSWFWLAAPLTGMIVQPIIGHYSDTTWGRFGRRKPYFLAGAILAAVALAFMPNASFLAGILPAVVLGAGFLMFMDASFNIAMEPFRALVADNLPDEQNTTGFSVQTTLIGIGAIAGVFFLRFLIRYSTYRMNLSMETFKITFFTLSMQVRLLFLPLFFGLFLPQKNILQQKENHLVSKMNHTTKLV
jgi:maltose/moltooligosaccharide transporter